MPKALKSCPKSNKSPDLVTLSLTKITVLLLSMSRRQLFKINMYWSFLHNNENQLTLMFAKPQYVLNRINDFVVSSKIMLLEKWFLVIIIVAVGTIWRATKRDNFGQQKSKRSFPLFFNNTVKQAVDGNCKSFNGVSSVYDVSVIYLFSMMFLSYLMLKYHLCYKCMFYFLFSSISIMILAPCNN